MRGTASIVRDNGADRLLKRADGRGTDRLMRLGLRNVHVGLARNTVVLVVHDSRRRRDG